MYGTLRYTTKDGNSSFISDLRPCNPAQGQEKHLACARCRSKKLRCSGQKSGCSRCRASSSTCSYFTPANGVASKPRKKSPETNDQSTEDSSSNDTQVNFRTTAPSSNECVSSMADQDSAEVQYNDGSTTRSSSDDDHQYITEFITSNNSLEVNDNFAAAITQPLEWRHAPIDGLQEAMSQEQFISRQIPQWPLDPDTDDMDFSRLVEGVFSPDETLRIHNGDLQACQFGLLKDPDASFARVANVKGFKDPFSNVLIATHDGHRYQSQQTSDRARPAPTALTRRRSQLTPPQLSSSPQPSSSSSKSPTPSNPPQHRRVDTREQTHVIPISMSTSRSVNSSDRTKVEATQRPCSCLQMTAAILEDIEVTTFSEDVTSIDVMMNFHQEALGELDTTLSCSSCVNRSEILMLLAMAMEKLVSYMEKACNRYKQELYDIDAGNSTFNSTGITSTSGSSSISHDARARELQTRRHNSADRASSMSSSSSLAQSPLCGSYKVSNVKDWTCLINVLLCLQLRTLGHSLKRMRSMPVITRLESHLAILIQCEDRVQRLRRSVSSKV